MRRAFIVAACAILPVCAACRAIVGVEDLTVAAADAGPKSDGGTEASSEAGPGPGAVCDPGTDCTACCTGAFPDAFARLLDGGSRECACGMPGTPRPCAMPCGGNQNVCPGSPGDGGSPNCESCIRDNLAVHTECASTLSQCRADLGCKPLADCLSACAPP